MKRLNIHRRPLIIIVLIVLTLANGGGLGYALRRSSSQTTVETTALKSELAPELEIKNSKQKDVARTSQGEQIGQGKYRFESLAKSKIDGEGQGQLTIAKNSDGARFVLALGADVFGIKDQLTEGWSMQTVAVDDLWSPGACASKPSFLLQGRYVFIDDGKTDPEDKYASYIVYDIQTGRYSYFGGNNFTDEQGLKERILSVANENDELVFYIDMADIKGPLAGSGSFKHSTGNEHGYVVRRVINPQNMTFLDYKIPYVTPGELAFYYLDPAYGSNLVTLRSDGSDKSYDGKVENNRLILALTPPPAPYVSGSDETELEQALSAPLKTALPAFINSASYDSAYRSDFKIFELGSSDKNNYLIVESRRSGNQTPVVYNDGTKVISPMTTKTILGYSNYVALGVY